MSWEHQINEGRVALLCYDYDLAEEYFRKALISLGKKSEVWNSFFSKTLGLLGETLFLKNNYAEAKFYFEQLESIFKYPCDDVYSRTVSNYCLGEIYLQQGNEDTAMRFFKSAAPDLALVFHGDHRYRQRIEEILGFKSYLAPRRRDSAVTLLEEGNLPLKPEQAEQSEKVYLVHERVSAMLAYSRELLHMATLAGRLEAYDVLNTALALSTWCTDHVSSDSSVLLSLMAEIAVMVRADDFAARLAHANLELNIARHGELSVEVVKAREILAALYVQQGHLQIADELFECAVDCLDALEVGAELVMPEGLKTYEKLREYRACLKAADTFFCKAEEYFKQGNLQNARKCLQKTRLRLLRCFPADSEVLLPVNQSLVTVYQQLGMPDMAHKVKRQILQIQQAKEERQQAKHLIVKELRPLAYWTETSTS